VTYAIIIGILIGYVIHSISTNFADSGESAIILMIPASPWIWFIPHALLGPITGMLCIGINGLLLGGLSHWFFGRK